MASERPVVTCVGCGRRSTMTADEEAAALAEAETLFGGPVPEEERRAFCHSCFIRFVQWFDKLSPEDHRAIKAGTYPREKLFPILETP